MSYTAQKSRGKRKIGKITRGMSKGNSFRSLAECWDARKQ